MSQDKVLAKIKYVVEVPKNWIDLITSSDIFRNDYCGLWLKKLNSKLKNGKFSSLALEIDQAISKENLALAHKHFRLNYTLPKYCYQLDTELAINSFAMGCEIWGKDWYENSQLSDGPHYSKLIQLVLFKEHRYA